jgi:hypothetical protein
MVGGVIGVHPIRLIAPFPYGFNPDPLYLPPGIDTSLTIHFTFPDQVPGGGGQFLSLSQLRHLGGLAEAGQGVDYGPIR